MKDLGKTIICMVREFTHGVMGGGMMENTTWIKSMDMECITGLMAGDMKDFGLMVSNTVKENTFYLTELLKLECGMMARE